MIEVIPILEQAEKVAQSVVKDVVCEPETKRVPRQLTSAVLVHVLVILVTCVIPTPEHAPVVVHDVIEVCVIFCDTIRVMSQLGIAVELHGLLEVLMEEFES